MISDKNKLLLILAAGFLLRITGVSFGLTYPDEHLVINHALAFGTGDLNPHMFYFPSLFLYILFFVYACFYSLGTLTGFFQGPDDFLTLFTLSPHIFYVIGRCVSVLFGTLTIGVVHRLAREAKGEKTAFAAALLMAVSFLHVRDSHFAVMDVTLTFFMTLCSYFLFRYLNRGMFKYLLFASVAAGVSAAVKYNGFILCVPIALAYGLGQRVFSLKRVLLDGALCAFLVLAAFFVFSPYVLLDLKTAAQFVQKLYGINRAFHFSWLHHARMTYFSLGGLIPFAAALGLLSSLRTWDKKNILFLSLPVLYYVMITRAGQPFERYVLPLLPFAVIWAADFLVSRRRFGRWFVLVVFLSALPKSLYSDALFLRADTRDLARQWMESNAPSESVVVIHDPGRAPKLAPTREQLLEKIRGLEAEPGPLTEVKAARIKKILDRQSSDVPAYRLYYLGADPSMKSAYTLLGPWVDYRVASLRRIKADLLVTDSVLMSRYPEFFKELSKVAQKTASFDPRRSLGVDLSPQDWAFMPIDDTLWNYKRNGPWVHILKLRWDLSG